MFKVIAYIVTALNLLLYSYLVITTAKSWRVSKAHRRLFFFTALSLFWIIDVVFQSVREASENWMGYIFFTHLNFSLAALIGAAIVGFSIHFPRSNDRVPAWKEQLLLLPTYIVAILSFSNLFVIVTGFRTVGNAPAYPVYLIVLLLYLIMIPGAILIQKVRFSKGVINQQLKYITTSYLIAIVILLAESAYLNLVKVITPEMDLLITDVTFFFASIVAYAMFRYRFMDVRVVVKKSIVYGVSLIITLGLYTYFALFIRETIENSWQLRPGLTAFILVALVASGFPLIKRLIEKSINAVFKDRKSIDLAVKELREEINKKKDLDALVDVITSEMKKYLGVGWTKCFVINREDKSFTYEEGGVEEHIGPDNDLLRHFEKDVQILVREELPHLLAEQRGGFDRELLQKVEKELKKLQASLAMPYRTEDGVYALFLLGRRTDQKPYSVQDIQYLEQLRQEVGFTLASALLYKEAMERVRLQAGETDRRLGAEEKGSAH